MRLLLLLLSLFPPLPKPPRRHPPLPNPWPRLPRSLKLYRRSRQGRLGRQSRSRQPKGDWK